MKKTSLFFLFLLFFLVGCGTASPKEDTPTDSDNPDIQTKNVYKLGDYGDYVKYADENKNPSTLEADYLELTTKIKESKEGPFESNYEQGLLNFFNIENKIKLSIDIKEEELKKLNEDYESGNKESYRICDLNILMGDFLFHYEEVGIRQKGNTSRGAILDDKGNINLRHYKLNFTATFDDEFTKTPMKWTDEAALEYRDNRNFFGIEKLNLRWNRNQETTYLREYYAFEMYRSNGVLAPHSNPMQLEMRVNGNSQNLGVYLAVEDIDKSFIKRNLVKASAGGDLYKMGWTSVGASLDSIEASLFGAEKQIEDNGKYKELTYPYDLKTNKKTSNHESIKGFIQNILSTDTSQFASFMNSEMIYDYMIRYFAISYLLGDPDDLRGNANNTYLYFLADTNQAIFIPTDHDRALGSTGGTGNPTSHHGALNKPFDSTTGYATNTMPFFTKAILEGGNQQIKKDYLEQIKEIIDEKWMDIDTFNSYFEKGKDHYSDALTLGDKVNGNKIAFSLIEESSLSSDWNLSIEVYLHTKKQTFLDFNWNPNEDIQISYSSYYLRGQMNDWNGISKEYALKIIDGTPTIELYLKADQPFKIAESDWSSEFNYEDLIDQTLFVSIGNEKNIAVKESGNYLIQIVNYNTEQAKLSIKRQD